MKFSKEGFWYTFNGNASVTTNIGHSNLANERSYLHKLFVEWMKLKCVALSAGGFFFKFHFYESGSHTEAPPRKWDLRKLTWTLRR